MTQGELERSGRFRQGATTMILACATAIEGMARHLPADASYRMGYPAVANVRPEGLGESQVELIFPRPTSLSAKAIALKGPVFTAPRVR